MEPSIFTKIINREIPANIIYEDDKTIAFLDIHPSQPGHTLVVPKVQISDFDELPDDYYQALWATVKKLAKRQKEILGKSRIGIQVIGLDVPHAHIHLIPFNTKNEYWTQADPNSDPNFVELKIIADKLKLGDY